MGTGSRHEENGKPGLRVVVFSLLVTALEEKTINLFEDRGRDGGAKYGPSPEGARGLSICCLSPLPVEDLSLGDLSALLV